MHTCYGMWLGSQGMRCCDGRQPMTLEDEMRSERSRSPRDGCCMVLPSTVGLGEAESRPWLPGLAAGGMGAPLSYRCEGSGPPGERALGTTAPHGA